MVYSNVGQGRAKARRRGYNQHLCLCLTLCLFGEHRFKIHAALTEFIREAQYAGDVAIFSDAPRGLQSLFSAYNDLAKKMGLCINTVKTETMCMGVPAEFFIDGTKLANVNRFNI